jgi:hypothetical protein
MAKKLPHGKSIEENKKPRKKNSTWSKQSFILGQG